MGTFGETGDGDGGWTVSANFKNGTIFTLTEDATITKLSVRCGTNFIAGEHLKLVIFNVSGGIPNTKEAVSEEIEGDGTLRWYDAVAGDLPIALSAGDYCLGVIEDADFSVRRVYGLASGYTTFRDADTYADGVENDWVDADSWADYRLCIYATYTTAPPAAVGGETKTSLVLTL